VKTDLKSHIRLVHEKPLASFTTKPISTEKIIENSTSNIAEDDTSENVVMDETTPQENHQGVNKAKDEPKNNDQSLDISKNMKESKDMNCEGVQDEVISSGLDDLPSDEKNSSNNVNIVSAEPKAVEVKTVPSLQAAVDDQTPSVLISTNPPDKAKEIIPYIPNVPKV